MRPIPTAPMLSRSAMEYLTQGGYYPFTITIQELIDEDPNSAGQQVRTSDGNWRSVVGLEGLRGAKAPEYPATPRGSTDKRMVDNAEDVDSQTLALNSYQPQIIKSWRALVDGEAWQIKAVESDSHKTYTRLRLERFKI